MGSGQARAAAVDFRVSEEEEEWDEEEEEEEWEKENVLEFNCCI